MRRWMRRAAFAVAATIYCCALFAGLLAPMSYEPQDREHLSEAPGRRFLLGTDELGRDRLSRLLYGSRTSLLLAPAAALLATAVAAILGIAAGTLGGTLERCTFYAVDLMTGTPTIFLLLTLRALLPLDVPAALSVAAMFAFLGLTGWASGVRVVSATARQVSEAGFALQARALGSSRSRLLFRQVMPNVAPVIAAQFWLAVPAFILAEANLSMLGLGVSEPLPSLGSLMAELQNTAAVAERPWMLAPALLLLLVTGSMQVVLRSKEHAA